ncbi:MAG: DNA adenine methylase [Cyanobacteria bacterium]|nr:DNA adenine methylase [Cyanobacteriota bacterium]
MFLESPNQKTQPHIESTVLSHGQPGLAKPFLKWVGGKTQLIDQLDSNVPPELKEGLVETYIEPFVGGGSFFFHVAQNYPIKNLVIADSNQDLILAYRTIRERVETLIVKLNEIQTRYLSLSDTKRADFYYATRKKFNEDKISVDFKTFSDDWIERTAELIFLNKTCFNGLFRVNAAGLFNVAFGRYENPRICDPNNLIAVAQILERTKILLGDFTCVRDHLDPKVFAYLDPPYRPISSTSNFTAYSSSTFTDSDQQRLADFCKVATSLGSRLMISNSDPDNIAPADTYFQDNFPGYRIVRAYANRMVNCKADRRGKISELIIMNYPMLIAKESDPKPPPTRRNAAALGAFQLLHRCARDGVPFDMSDLQKATGWKVQTARTYLSKKWKNYLEPVEGKKSSEFSVKPIFLELDENSFLTEFSQVLAGSKPSRPQTLEEAREQALAALGAYADMLGAAESVASEKKVRSIVDQIIKEI